MANSMFLLNETEKGIPYILFYDKEGDYVPAHWHKEIEIILCTKGKTNVVINNNVYELCERDIAVVLGGDTHLYFKTQEHERMVVMFDYSLLENYNNDNAKRKELQAKLRRLPRVSSLWNSEHGRAAHDLLKELERLNEQNVFGRDLAIRARVYDFIFLMCNGVMSKSMPEVGDDTNVTKTLLNLEKIFNFVENNYKRELTLGDAANVLGFTDSYFARFFKKYAGETFLTYLNGFRINKARDLLFTDNYSVGRIGEEVGIPNVKTFNRLFKKAFNLAPTQYRKSIYEEK